MSVERKLQALEEQLLTSAARANAKALGRLLHDEFVEFGSSGRIFDKPKIIAALAQGSPWQYTLSEFRVVRLSEDTYLVTYRLTIGELTSPSLLQTLRSSIWKCVGSEWKLFFHQGTRTNAL